MLHSSFFPKTSDTLPKILVKIFRRDQQVILLLLGLTILLIGLFRLAYPFRSFLESSQNTFKTEPHPPSIIQVAGAVKNPGIYIFDRPPTARQVIQRAGGPTANDSGSFEDPDNRLESAVRLEVQESDGDRPGLIITPMGSRERLILGIRVDLNEADVEDLAVVPGISLGLAGRIVAFRKTHGPFRTWDDLRRVKGIGPKKVESLQSYLRL